LWVFEIFLEFVIEKYFFSRFNGIFSYKSVIFLWINCLWINLIKIIINKNNFLVFKVIFPI
jgi:hypothetical protein